MSLLSASSLPTFFPTTTQTLKRTAATNLQFVVRSSDTTAEAGVSVEGGKQGTVEKVSSLGSNGVAAAVPKNKEKEMEVVEEFPKFGDSRWVNGTWDLHQFKKDGGFTDWDSVIDAGELVFFSFVRVSI